MNEGYIKLHRQIKEDPLWREKPFDRARAWVDLYLSANFADVTTIIKGSEVTIRRGQVLRGEDTLADDWGWSRGKVRRFLSHLVRTGKVTKIGTKFGTLITIENYSTEQDGRPEIGTTDGTGDGTADGTGDKKNKKNKKNKKRERPTLADVSTYVDEMNYSMDPAAFFDYYEETGWMKKNGTPVRDWKAAARTWERREKQFAKSEQPKKPAQVEPPKYEEFEPDPEVKDAIPMPEEIRKKLRGAFS